MVKSSLKQFEKWHKSREGLLIFGIAELVLAYLIGSRAIDTGSLIEYFLTIVLLIGGIQNIMRLLLSVMHGSKR